MLLTPKGIRPIGQMAPARSPMGPMAHAIDDPTCHGGGDGGDPGVIGAMIQSELRIGCRLILGAVLLRLPGPRGLVGHIAARLA